MNNPSKFWKTIKSLTNTSVSYSDTHSHNTSIMTQLITDNQCIANHFNQDFISAGHLFDKVNPDLILIPVLAPH